jgi:transcriptional regulator with AAA-type ATPase domain
MRDGESGTGKRVLADMFHAASPRRAAGFQFISCGPLDNENMIKSQLFGHKKGSFSEAYQDHVGVVPQAGAGVFVLDDFHQITPPCVRVLHPFLDDGYYSLLGAEATRTRTPAAGVLTVETDLWSERRDQLDRSFVARAERYIVQVPPLRFRPDDLEYQARWYFARQKEELNDDPKVGLRLGGDVIEHLQEHGFPGTNTRVLRTIMEKVVTTHHRGAPGRELTWREVEPVVPKYARQNGKAGDPPTAAPRGGWPDLARRRAANILAAATGVKDDDPDVEKLVDALFGEAGPVAQGFQQYLRATKQFGDGAQAIDYSAWHELFRCYSLYHLGTPQAVEAQTRDRVQALRIFINGSAKKRRSGGAA